MKLSLLLPRIKRPLLRSRAVWMALSGVATATLHAADYTHGDLGPFQGGVDVGKPARSGSATYEATNQLFRIRGSGANMWFDRDECHYVWTRLKGNFILRARADFLGDGVDPHRKLGWMVRRDVQADSPQVSAAVHGDGLTSLQFRRAKGGQTEESRSSVRAAQVIQLERQDRTYRMSVARFGEPFVTTTIADLNLGEAVFVGLFVCAHNPQVTEEAVFRNVRIIIPAPDGFVPYRDYIGSNLEIMDVFTGQRTVVHQTPDSMQAPNWTPDGKALIYNRNGRLNRLDLAQRTVAPLETGFADRNNNDHVLSFDGKHIGISHHVAAEAGKSVVFVLPAEGGVPRRVTSNAPSYLHGWSPDGMHLVYTGERKGEFDVYQIPVAGGDEARLTTAPGLDDGPEYTPDGRWIYFNSERTGHMQIWRMKPDGTEQEPVTHDEFNNWFPHISPDGKWIVFLSFAGSVKPNDHPFYQQVYLRRMAVAGGAPQVIGYVYGGQGTINVPSWSPDSRQIAFVSNSALPESSD